MFETPLPESFETNTFGWAIPYLEVSENGIIPKSSIFTGFSTAIDPLKRDPPFDPALLLKVCLLQRESTNSIY